jgi:hypothetical protein
MKLYYEVYCKFETSGYSIPVEIDTDELLTDDEVISYCEQNNLFYQEADKYYVDYVNEIDQEDYQDLKGC